MIRPTPAKTRIVVIPTLNGSTRTNMDSRSRRIPPQITAGLPESLKVLISPPNAIAMKLWYISHNPIRIGRTTTSLYARKNKKAPHLRAKLFPFPLGL